MCSSCIAPMRWSVPEEVAAAFDTLEAKGKVRDFGVSNHSPGQIDTDVANPVTYPFKVGGVTIDKQRAGQRVYDINADGVAQYGLYPDWIQDLTKVADSQKRGDGAKIEDDLARGAEAYLQMWERASRTRARLVPQPGPAQAGGQGRGSRPPRHDDEGRDAGDRAALHAARRHVPLLCKDRDGSEGDAEGDVLEGRQVVGVRRA